mmetsp:Transcript_5810/g.17554  ORF Transcript_5810/g.17554 Transcript_5810/m.17554 type:complete len:273 (-) Transcript_5810:1727-2545(-)
MQEVFHGRRPSAAACDGDLPGLPQVQVQPLPVQQVPAVQVPDSPARNAVQDAPEHHAVALEAVLPRPAGGRPQPGEKFGKGMARLSGLWTLFLLRRQEQVEQGVHVVRERWPGRICGGLPGDPGGQVPGLQREAERWHHRDVPGDDPRGEGEALEQVRRGFRKLGRGADGGLVPGQGEGHHPVDHGEDGGWQQPRIHPGQEQDERGPHQGQVHAHRDRGQGRSEEERALGGPHQGVREEGRDVRRSRAFRPVPGEPAGEEEDAEQEETESVK